MLPSRGSTPETSSASHEELLAKLPFKAEGGDLTEVPKFPDTLKHRLAFSHEGGTQEAEPPPRSSLLSCCRAPQYLTSESVREVYGEWVQPDEAEAKQRYHERHPHHTVYDMTQASVRDFKDFGAGILLYFYFLKGCAIIFGILAICPAAIQITMNVGGGFLSERANFDTLTLGNFGLQSSNVNAANLNITLPSSNNGADAEIAILKLFLADGDNPSAKMESIKFDKRVSIVTMSAIDLGMTAVFFSFCIFLIWNVKRLTKMTDDQTVTIADYAVRVQFVPKDVTREELKAYFEQWGPVVQVDLARRCSELVALVEDRTRILYDLDLAIAKLQKQAEKYPMVKESYEDAVLDYKYDLSLVNEAIKATQLGQAGEDVVEAYVTFLDDISRDRCIEGQPRSWAKRLLRDKSARFRGLHDLLVTTAPEPTDIKFEYLQAMAPERFFWRTFTLALKVILIAAGFTAVSLAPAIRRSLGATTSKPDEQACNDACDWKDASGNLRLPDDLRPIYKSCFLNNTNPETGQPCGEQTICYECFCKTALQQSMYEERSYCDRFQNVLLVATAAQALAVVVIVTTNVSVKLLIEWLSSLERHHTRSREVRSTTRALFTTQLLNFAASIVVANAYLPRAQEAMGNSKASLIFFGGIYPDVTPNWYRDVGKPIMVSHLLGILVRHAFIFLPAIVRSVRMSMRNKALTQAQLNAAYQGHEFEIAIRYGEHLTAIFVCWLFSSGMPLMYWSCFASFLLHYWTERYELLKVAQLPVNYSSDLPAFVASVMPISTILHLLAAVWAYSVIGVPRSPLAGGGVEGVMDEVADAFHGLWEYTTELRPQQVSDRLAQNNAMHLLYGILVLLFVLITFQTWRKWLEFFDWLVLTFRDLVRDPKHAVDHLASNAVKLGSKAATKERERQGEAPSAVVLERAQSLLREGEEEQEGEGKDKAEPSVSGIPEFPLAVRSKLLGGPSTYDICKNPLYAHYFERLEDFWMEEAAMAKVEARERANRTKLQAVLAFLPGLSDEKRRRERRRQKARDMLDRHGHALMLAGEAGQHVYREPYQARQAQLGEQVAAAARRGYEQKLMVQQRMRGGSRVAPEAPMFSFSAAPNTHSRMGRMARSRPMLSRSSDSGNAATSPGGVSLQGPWGDTNASQGSGGRGGGRTRAWQEGVTSVVPAHSHHHTQHRQQQPYAQHSVHSSVPHSLGHMPVSGRQQGLTGASSEQESEEEEGGFVRGNGSPFAQGVDPESLGWGGGATVQGSGVSSHVPGDPAQRSERVF